MRCLPYRFKAQKLIPKKKFCTKKNFNINANELQLPKEQNVSSAIPSKLSLNFNTPYGSIHSKSKVDAVLMTTSNGKMSISPGHVPVLQELIPGLLKIENDSKTEKFLVSGGYALMHSDSTVDICVEEAVEIDKINHEVKFE